MLIHEPEIMHTDPILSFVAKIRSVNGNVIKIKDGIYEIGHFGGSHFLPDYDHYPEFDHGMGSYGVSDDYAQILAKYPELENSESRKFVITLSRIVKNDEPWDGGWRWHKWGEYIGDKNPQHEYIKFEDDSIQQVFCYHIYEKIEKT